MAMSNKVDPKRDSEPSGSEVDKQKRRELSAVIKRVQALERLNRELEEDVDYEFSAED